MIFSNKRLHGFTLAEVLITIGIIGVVAAITLPTLMTKITNRVFESQFKKSVSILSQLSRYVQYEIGECTPYDYNGLNDELTNAIDTYMKDKLTIKTSVNNAYGGKFKTYNYKDTTDNIHVSCLRGETLITGDGTSYSFCKHNNYGNLISVDLNGPYKGPNAYGHDLFFFNLDRFTCELISVSTVTKTCTEDEMKTDKTCQQTGYYTNLSGVCSPSSNSSYNGISCGKFAMQDRCPDGSGRKYFDCLR